MLAEKKNIGKEGRDFGADVVRVTALGMVLWLHFYLRNGFYYSEITDAWGFIAVLFRPVLMCSVPLFLMLTGYLKCGKKWDGSYYRSLWPILLSYALISLIHLPYKIFIGKQEASALEWVRSFLDFKLAEYGWYVGMYIGLFLLSPLMNLLWDACQTKRARQAAVLTLVVVTFLPAAANGTKLGNLLPAYFQGCFYLTYYLIGCYIRTYRPRPKKWLCLFLVLSLGAVLAWMNLATRTDPGNYYTGYTTGYNGLLEGTMTTALFLFLYSMDTKRAVVRALFMHVSGLVFETYLLSYIADVKIFSLRYKEYPMSLYLPVGLAMTLAVFLVTYPLALFVNRLVRRITKRQKKTKP